MANSRSWSIYGNSEISQRYEILERVGYGAYADVYRAKRRDDGLLVALKEVHDYRSAYREIEALRLLRSSSSPNVVTLHEFFWNEDDDAVLVLEYLPTDLATVIDEAKKRVGDGGEGIHLGEIKRWMLQILEGVAACHGNWVVHRDLKPGNLLISADGILKLADFGQSRILQEPGFLPGDDNSKLAEVQDTGEQAMVPQGDIGSTEENMLREQASVGWLNNVHDPEASSELNQKDCEDDLHKTDNLVNMQDTGSSFFSSISDHYSNNPLDSPCHEGENMDENQQGLTSCVGTRWYRAPELLYGSTNYGFEIDLWSVGCIFAELLALKPLFQGTADIDQLAKIIRVLGNINEQTWPGCSSLPDYGKISFKDIQVPPGLKACLPNCSQSEVFLVEKLVCYDPMARATALQLMGDPYFNEEPLAVPTNKLKVPSARSTQESSAADWDDQAWKNLGANSDSDDFDDMDFVQTDKGFSMRFS